MVAENNDFSAFHKYSRKLLAHKLDEIILVEPKVVKWYNEKYQHGFWFPIIKPDNAAREEYARVLPTSNHIISEKHLENKCIFLYVGRLVKIKNVDTIIRAFSKLDQNKNALVIVGDGEEKVSLMNLANQLAVNVEFTGRLEGDALNAWYNIAHCFVLASYKEPFGAVTNEALLAGCISIISNKAGSSCLIEENKNGFLFDPMDTEQLTRIMRQVSSVVTIDYPVKLKPNQMTYQYQDFMQSLIERIDTL